jgi:hypothetical protein
VILRVYTHLQCDCGHRGLEIMRENTSAHSEPWTDITYVDGDNRAFFGGIETTFVRWGRQCPACGRGGPVR